MRDDGLLITSELPNVRLYARGKVRDIYDLGDQLLLVATDRISAFDVVLPNGIPHKGKVLTQLSAFWFGKTAHLVRNHLITCDTDQFPPQLQPFRDQLQGRAMLVIRAKRVDAECVVRGYLAGSGWREYRERGSICGQPLPAGLRQGEKLPEPIFTPATKAESGHDENITLEELERRVGTDLAEQLAHLSLTIYNYAERFARQRGIIIADTKMEYGFVGDELVLIDELLTPDSSRFWAVEEYVVGQSPPSFDKQFVRDWLEQSGWNKQPPAPVLPPEVVEKTSAKYQEAYYRLTGEKLFI